LKESAQALDLPLKPQNSDYIAVIRDQIKEFSKKKRKWLKAFEILECIVLKIDFDGGKKEYKIAKYQFLLNFLSKKSNEELNRFIDEQFRFIPNVSEFIRDTVIPLL
jgi:hypothetical protein